MLTNNNQPKTRRRDGGGKGEEVRPGGSAGEVREGVALSLYRPVLIFRPPFASSELSNFDAFYLKKS